MKFMDAFKLIAQPYGLTFGLISFFVEQDLAASSIEDLVASFDFSSYVVVTSLLLFVESEIHLILAPMFI